MSEATPDLRGFRAEIATAGVVVLAYLVAAVVGAFLWLWLTPLPEAVSFEREGQVYSQLSSEVAIAQIFDADAVFVLVAALMGVALGVGLGLWWQGDPRVKVVVVGGAAALASWVMPALGHWIGPADPAKVLADQPVGSMAPIQLGLSIDVGYLVWPFASLVGLLLVLLIVLPPDPSPLAPPATGSAADETRFPQGEASDQLQ